MAKRRRRDRGKELFWRRTMRSWRRSGQTMRAFCAGHGLAESAFHFWRRELKQRDQEVRSRSEGRERVRRRSVPAFVPVRPVAAPAPVVVAPNRSSGIAIVLAERRLVRVEAGFDAATLERVVAVLEGRPC